MPKTKPTRLSKTKKSKTKKSNANKSNTNKSNTNKSNTNNTNKKKVSYGIRYKKPNGSEGSILRITSRINSEWLMHPPPKGPIPPYPKNVKRRGATFGPNVPEHPRSAANAEVATKRSMRPATEISVIEDIHRIRLLYERAYRFYAEKHIKMHDISVPAYERLLYNSMRGAEMDIIRESRQLHPFFSTYFQNEPKDEQDVLDAFTRLYDDYVSVTKKNGGAIP